MITDTEYLKKNVKELYFDWEAEDHDNKKNDSDGRKNWLDKEKKLYSRLKLIVDEVRAFSNETGKSD